MPTKAYVEQEDHDGEKNKITFWVQDVSGANYASVMTDISEVRGAIADVTLGEIRADGFSKRFPQSAAAVTNKIAQRETKWLIVSRDTTQFLDVANTIANSGYLKIFTSELGCADLTLLLANDDKMDLAAGFGAALKTEWEANVRSPWNHSAAVVPTIALLEVRHVGRNS